MTLGRDRRPATLSLRVHPVPDAVAGAVLVHGLASNAAMWDACARALGAAGITSVAIDLRGHGRSARLDGDGPHTTGTAAADVTELVDLLRADGTLPGPVVLAGQSWGGNVVLRAAADRPDLVDGLALVDGGWLRFEHDESFDVLWQRLAPPTWAGTTWADVVGRLGGMLAGWGPHALPAVLANLRTDEHGQVRNVLDLDAHRDILRSMYDDDPRQAYPQVVVPVLLAPAGPGGASGRVDEAVDGLARPTLVRYPDSHHDIHLQHPEQLAADLARLLDPPTHPQEHA